MIFIGGLLACTTCTCICKGLKTCFPEQQCDLMSHVPHFFFRPTHIMFGESRRMPSTRIMSEHLFKSVVDMKCCGHSDQKCDELILVSLSLMLCHLQDNNNNNTPTHTFFLFFFFVWSGFSKNLCYRNFWDSTNFICAVIRLWHSTLPNECKINKERFKTDWLFPGLIVVVGIPRGLLQHFSSLKIVGLL